MSKISQLALERKAFAKKRLIEIGEYVKNHGCKLLSESYVSDDVYLRFLCKCGRYFETTFTMFKRGKTKCGYCTGRIDKGRKKKRMSWTKSEMKNFVEIHSESGCKFLSADREGVSANVTLRCYCGNVFTLRFDFFRDRFKRRRCEECAIKEEYNKVKSFVEKHGCKLLSDKYTNCDEKMLFECGCGNSFVATYAAFKYMGTRKCRDCSKVRSEGEIKIHDFLKRKGIYFDEEYGFEKCKNKTNLLFDFAINDDRFPFSLIEYDGEQHYEAVRFGGISEQRAKKALKAQKKNDRIKNKYCKDNNIPLLRIPYWDFNKLEDTLSEWLS